MSPSQEFFEALVRIVGRANADLYARKFGPLDELFLNDIRNYEALAFFTYTTKMGWFQIINEALWTCSASSDVLLFRQVLNGALSKLQSYKANGGEVYRGFQAQNVYSFAESYALGEIVEFLGFTSATFHASAAFGGNVFFTIRSLNAKAIWFIAEDFWEHEVLFPTNCRFKVVDCDLRGKVGASDGSERLFIVLEEV